MHSDWSSRTTPALGRGPIPGVYTRRSAANATPLPPSGLPALTGPDGLPPRRRRDKSRLAVRAKAAVVCLVAAMLPPIWGLGPLVSPAQAATSCPAAGCAVTVDARDFRTATALPHFN